MPSAYETRVSSRGTAVAATYALSLALRSRR
jgi:hypothetical protein